MTLARLRRALADPRRALYVQGGRWAPERFFKRYGRLARAAGLDGLDLLLSFDCDTPEDAGVAWEVHQRLADLGIQPAYAVPGELLMANRAVYGKIRDSGAEFINHGYFEHTFFDPEKGRHRSHFFYHEQSPEKIREDVTRADACLRETLGVAPRGYRTPHFGSYQQPGQLDFLYRILVELGYRFSSSTTPYHAFRHGPLIRQGGILEIPVMGMASDPMQVFDTWAFFRAPDRTLGPADFLREGERLLELLAAQGGGLINIYGDPSHIHDSPEFFDLMARFVAQARPVGFAELLARGDGGGGERQGVPDAEK